MLLLDRDLGVLAQGTRQFDGRARVWRDLGKGAEGEKVTMRQAVAWLQRESGHPMRAPIGVIGPREAGPEQLQAAYAVGRELALMGLTVVCGGRQGVMEAVCHGVADGHGLSIGLLPEPDFTQANAFVTVPIATGIGEARNALVARASFCLVAIGNSYGTLSEVALGLQFGKQVFGIHGAAEVQGVRQIDRVEALIDHVAEAVLGLDALPI